MSEKKSILEKISEGQVWKSIFRGGGVPTTRRQRMMVVLNSVFLKWNNVQKDFKKLVNNFTGN